MLVREIKEDVIAKYWEGEIKKDDSETWKQNF